MLQSRQNYRKKLSSVGFLFMRGIEHEIIIRNLSISGLLVELEVNSDLINIHDVFDEINHSTVVDLFIPEMRLAGEADIVRVDKVENVIYMGLEFKNINFDVDQLLYKRKVYRKNMTAPGQIVFAGQPYQFKTRNVSVDGLMIHIEDSVTVEVGTVATFEFPKLSLQGEAKVIWVEYNQNDGVLMGLKYMHMGKNEIKGIPAFAQ